MDAAGAAGLYLHCPFCSVVCPYCDFAVLTGRPDKRRRFAEALVREIELRADAPFSFDTVYFGGGTPTAQAPEELASILEAARRHLSVAPEALVSLEANPEDVSAESLAVWRELGAGTLSLGVQSFDDDALRLLGRRHSAEQARRAVELALGAGFETVSVDLIFALPGRDEASWFRELEAAAELGSQHVSCYQLTFHEGTPFHAKRERGELVEPGEPEQARLFRLTHERLAAHGLEAYEVSNFARGEQHRSRHNRKYWRHEPYLGLGPSAHSFDGRRRWWNERELKDWQAAVEGGELPTAGEESLAPEQLALEALMLGLRTTEGIDFGRIRERTGRDLLGANRELIERLESEGLARLVEARLQPTLDGLAVADSLAALFRLD